MITENPKFEDGFDNYICEGDTIETTINGIVYVATIHHDDNSESPEEREDGFWPSLNPKSDGYIGAKSQSTLRRHTAHAQHVMDSWRNDEWFYCGIVISAYIEDDDGERVCISEHAASLWGVECNYPAQFKRQRRQPNAFVDECADELLGEAMNTAEEAKAALHRATA